MHDVRLKKQTKVKLQMNLSDLLKRIQPGLNFL